MTRRRKGKGIDWSGFAFGKGKTHRASRDERHEDDRAVAATVRAIVFDRDVGCRVPADVRWPHSGVDEWAHMEQGTRARTRGRAPVERHTTRLSCRLCRGHHVLYDQGPLRPRFLTDRGADGPIEWTVEGEVVGGGR